MFELIFKRYYNALFFFAGRFVADRNDSENLVQETFMALWLNRKNILKDSENSVKAWLYNTLRNKCLNYLEKEASKNKYSAYLKTKHLLDVSVLRDFEINEVLFDEIHEILEKALNDMPKQSRAVFEMSRLKGMKNKEIADSLNVSVKAVEANMTRALKHLKVHFRDYISILILLCSL